MDTARDYADRGLRFDSYCHLLADTRDELHDFAAAVGMPRVAFQDHPWRWHYDLPAVLRPRAIELGAFEVDLHGVGALLRRRRATSGTGTFSRDGCPVEVYRRLPVGDELQAVGLVGRPGASVLDLGAGVGRLADPLAARGHRVVAVDESDAMLAEVRTARTVRSRIETLRLDDRFDVVLLASHLVNTPHDPTRHALLATVAHHLADDGHALVQWHPPAWFDALEPGRVYSGRIGELHSELEVHARRGDVISAEVRYSVDGGTWRQPFEARRLTRESVADALAAVGLELVTTTLADDWLVARRSAPSEN